MVTMPSIPSMVVALSLWREEGQIRQLLREGSLQSTALHNRAF